MFDAYLAIFGYFHERGKKHEIFLKKIAKLLENGVVQTIQQFALIFKREINENIVNSYIIFSAKLTKISLNITK